MKRIREYLNLEKEFYESEERYINYLQLIVDLYLIPLKSLEGTTEQILDKKEINLIFSNSM